MIDGRRIITAIIGVFVATVSVYADMTRIAAQMWIAIMQDQDEASANAIYGPYIRTGSRG